MRKRKAHGGKGPSSAGLRGRIWIDGDEGTFLGYGRVVLLERIAEYGSITKAAKSMQMSYRHAWELVDSMNQQSPSPLVEASTGGKRGGGARLTGEGENAIHIFWQFFSDFQDFLAAEIKQLSQTGRLPAALRIKKKVRGIDKPRRAANKEET